jgi:hypothetical protein
MKRFGIFLMVVFWLASGIYVMAENNLTGTGAGGKITTGGDENVVIGADALASLRTGFGNTIIGQHSSHEGWDYSGAVKLGYMAGYADTSSHKLFINTGFYPTKGLFGDFSTGYFGINNTAPTVALDVTGAITASTTVTGATGNFTTSTLTTATIANLAPGSVVGSSTSTNITYFAIRANTNGAGADSSLYIGNNAGQPYTQYNSASGAGVYVQSVNNSDVALFTGASGGYNYDASVTAPIKIINIIGDSTLTLAMSPAIVLMRALSSKATVTFPADPTGCNFLFIVADSDSGIIKVASPDSLIDGGYSRNYMSAAGSGATVNTLHLFGISAGAVVGATSTGNWAKY